MASFRALATSATSCPAVSVSSVYLHTLESGVHTYVVYLPHIIVYMFA